MTKLLLAFLLCFGVLAHAQLGPVLHPHALDDRAFGSCDEILRRALELGRNIDDPAYLIELFPRSQGRVGPPFLSERTASFAAQWLASHDPNSLPYALFYFAKGAYTLRCRDNDGRYVKRSGPSSSSGPLDLNLADGKAEVLHFYFTPINLAHAFVITQIPLQTLNGNALMAKVKDLLGARSLFLYVRNDPWFLGVAPDPLAYLFTNSFKRISEQEYRESQMLTCYSGSGCKLASSP
jgi:hypothetical protein